jgi:hypothetical protein
VFYAVRPVYESDFRLVTNDIDNKWRPIFILKKLGRAVRETHASDRILFSPTVVAGVKGLYLRCTGPMHYLEFRSVLRLEMCTDRPSCKVVAIIASFEEEL